MACIIVDGDRFKAALLPIMHCSTQIWCKGASSFVGINEKKILIHWTNTLEMVVISGYIALPYSSSLEKTGVRRYKQAAVVVILD